jgi:hypothetical protein
MRGATCERVVLRTIAGTATRATTSFSVFFAVRGSIATEPYISAPIYTQEIVDRLCMAAESLISRLRRTDEKGDKKGVSQVSRDAIIRLG